MIAFFGLCILCLFQVKSTRISCQMVPIKTENGEVKYYCDDVMHTSIGQKEGSVKPSDVNKMNFLLNKDFEEIQQEKIPASLSSSKEQVSPNHKGNEPVSNRKLISTDKRVTESNDIRTNSTNAEHKKEEMSSTNFNLTNRNNIDAPCKGQKKKTRYGDCETIFG